MNTFSRGDMVELPSEHGGGYGMVDELKGDYCLVKKGDGSHALVHSSTIKEYDDEGPTPEELEQDSDEYDAEPTEEDLINDRDDWWTEDDQIDRERDLRDGLEEDISMTEDDIIKKPDVVKKLTDQGLDINLKDDNTTTPTTTKVMENKKTKKTTSKKQLNENWIQEAINWIVQNWNDARPVVDEFGNQTGGTYGQYFRITVSVILGLPLSGVMLYNGNKILSALKAAPGKVKSIIKAVKAIKGVKTPEDATQKVQQATGKVINFSDAIKKVVTESKNKKKVAKKKTLTEAQKNTAIVKLIEKISGKKVVFKENKEK